MTDITYAARRITYHPGRNIVDDDADVLVNTVNAVGVMGKGVALAFARRWPGIVDLYKDDCRSGYLKAGGCVLYPLPRGGDRSWAALATKDHWRQPSRMAWIESGLARLADHAGEIGYRSIAIPPPGCGNGGLDWREVEPIVLRHLGGFDLRIYGEKTT